MYNTATLIGYYGGDKTHANSAWQSTNVELNLNLSPDINKRVNQIYDATVRGKKKSSGDLLKMLAEAGHETPFEKSTLHFQLTTDISTHIHCIKHRIGVSINSESARYKELKDKWYTPPDWENIRVEYGLNNPDLIDFLVDDNIFTWGDVLNKYCELGHDLYHESLKQIEGHLGRKRAKESARMFLPYAKQLDFDMMFNFRSFIHFQNLRNSPYAQQEVSHIAQQMLNEVKNIPGNPFMESLMAFGY